MIAGLSWLSYTIVDQQEQIEQLQEQLQHEQMKYKIIINDPLVRDAMESGGWMMDIAVIVVVTFFATVFASVIFGKELDEKEKEAIA